MKVLHLGETLITFMPETDDERDMTEHLLKWRWVEITRFIDNVACPFLVDYASGCNTPNPFMVFP